MNCQNRKEKHSCGDQHSIKGHPCFNKDAHHRVGRMHLAVAPKCNIKCNYCSRRHDCANENRPGVTSKIINPQQALEKVRQGVEADPRIKVVGIAGPGDPLANQETLETMALLQQEFPQLMKCLSTNGLMLPSRMQELTEVGLNSLTVTVNTLDPEVGAKIYSWVRYQNQLLLGQEGAAQLIENQLIGIAQAVEKGITVKVNTVFIPGINQQCIEKIAEKIKRLGVYLMNIMSLIPQAQFAHLTASTPEEINQIRNAYSPIISQMEHCRQCRADAVGLIGST